MFEEEIMVLKQKYDLICEELRILTDEYNKNKENQEKVDNLRKCKSDLKFHKELVFVLAFSCLIGTVLASLLMAVAYPTFFMSLFSVIIIGSGLISSILIGYGICDYIVSKIKYKKMATAENVELENNIDNILKDSLSLEERIKLLQEIKDKYEEIINYFEEYNNKVSLLKSLVIRSMPKAYYSKNNSEDLCIEDSCESKDYSEDNLTESVGLDDAKTKNLLK